MGLTPLPPCQPLPVSFGPGIHPRDAPRPTESKGEDEVWNALQTGMPSGWYGWHSLRIRDPNGYEGEGDFVSHPRTAAFSSSR